MLIIRLFRVGKKNQPAFKIVVTDKRKSATRGVYVEEVGFWNPLTKEKVLKQERIKYWLSVGAKPSATIHNLLISEKISEGNKIPVHKKKKVKEGSAEAEKIEVPVAKTESSPIPEKKEPPKKEEPKAEIPKEETPVPAETAPAAEPSSKEESKVEALKEEMPAPEPTQREESKPEPPKKEEPFEEDKSSSRPSPSEEGSGAEEKKVEVLTEEKNK